jgi:hypothetical protein
MLVWRNSSLKCDTSQSCEKRNETKKITLLTVLNLSHNRGLIDSPRSCPSGFSLALDFRVVALANMSDWTQNSRNQVRSSWPDQDGYEGYAKVGDPSVTRYELQLEKRRHTVRVGMRRPDLFPRDTFDASSLFSQP